MVNENETDVWGFQRSIKEIVNDLKKPIAVKHLQKRRQGGKEITYLAWSNAVLYLDHYAPGWNYEITRIDNIAGKVILTVRISIPCLEGVVYRDATGQEDEDTDSWGDSTSNSESMALRRAASKFGLALYLYNYDNPMDYHTEYEERKKKQNGGSQAVPKSEPIPEPVQPGKTSQNASNKQTRTTEDRGLIVERKLSSLIALTQKHSLAERKWAGEATNFEKESYDELTEPEIDKALSLISAEINKKTKG